MKNCSDCGKEFEPYQWNQKRCYDCIERTDKRFKQRPKKTCTECGKEFQPRTVRQEYCSDECGKNAWERGYFRRTYGISREEYLQMFEDQGHKCKICGTKGFKINENAEKKLCVDHCHTSGEIRGLLCHNCNRALGLFQDNIDYMKSAIEYLEGSETIRKE